MYMKEKVCVCSTRLAARMINSSPQVDLCNFASDLTVQELLKETEEQFTTRFGRDFLNGYLVRFLMNSYTAQGDRKRALTFLRTSTYSQKTHHFSSFRAGMALGLAFPAFVDGIIRSTSSPFFHTATEALQGFQDRTRAALPAWGSLLYIYAIFLVPTLFAFLIGADLLIWNASRINYVFIFGKDLASFPYS